MLPVILTAVICHAQLLRVKVFIMLRHDTLLLLIRQQTAETKA